MVINRRFQFLTMHTAGKVLLIIGGVITVLGIAITVMGAASAELDPSKENEWEGTDGPFTIPSDDIYGVYTKGSVDCNAIGSTITIEITKDAGTDSATDVFEKECENNTEDDYLDDDYQRVGTIEWLIMTNAGDEVIIDSDVEIYIVGDIEAFGEAVGGIFAAAGGILIAICGGVILLIGLILALTLKTKDPVIVQQGQMMGGQMMAGQMPMQQMPAQQMPMQQMPAQQMPAQTTAQPFEYEQK